MRTLKFGDNGDDVRQLQEILEQQGFFKLTVIVGNFLTLTLQAVVDFQMTHIGPDGKQLVVDGIVGKKTWWALMNPSGNKQKSNIKAVTAGLTPGRQALLDVALQEHRRGVKEVPDGSNKGDGVSKYLRDPDGGEYWCMYFVTWCHTQAGFPLLDERKAGHVLTMWRAAQSLSLAHMKLNYSPIPGDTMIMLYRNKMGKLTGRGHCGIVSAVSSDGGRYNLIEGNSGNRVKQTLRRQEQNSLVGFINHWPLNEQPTNYQTGVSEGSSEERTT